MTPEAEAYLEKFAAFKLAEIAADAKVAELDAVRAVLQSQGDKTPEIKAKSAALEAEAVQLIDAAKAAEGVLNG